MPDLDEVISKVERIELSTHTRERQLARLHALQRGRADIGATAVVAGRPVSARGSRAAWSGGLAAAAVAVVAGASALLVPVHHGAIPIAPGAGALTVVSSASPPTDQVKKAEGASGPSSGPGHARDGNSKAAGTGLAATTGAPRALVKSTAQNPGQNLLTSGHSVDLLAAALGLSRQKSAELAGELADLEHGAGLDPRSSGFQAVAQDFGLTPDQLARAIEQIKRAAK